MEKIPFRESGAVIGDVTGCDLTWHQELPVLAGDAITLREVRLSDAPMLLAMLGTEEVSRFMSLPATLEEYERGIAAALKGRAEGHQFCFAIVPKGMDDAVGALLVKQLEPGFATAEWRFAIGSPYWGTEVFAESARLVIDFSFRTVGIHRLEARAAVKNGRGNGALRKIGAAQEGVLRRSFVKDGECFDQVLWAVVACDWQALMEEAPCAPVH